MLWGTDRGLTGKEFGDDWVEWHETQICQWAIICSGKREYPPPIFPAWQINSGYCLVCRDALQVSLHGRLSIDKCGWYDLKSGWFIWELWFSHKIIPHSSGHQCLEVELIAWVCMSPTLFAEVIAVKKELLETLISESTMHELIRRVLRDSSTRRKPALGKF